MTDIYFDPIKGKNQNSLRKDFRCMYVSLKSSYKANKAWLVASIMSLITIFYLQLEGIENSFYYVLIFINSFIALYEMFENPSRPYSLKKFVFLFFYIFFILANAVQFAHKSNHLTFTLNFNDSDYIFFQIYMFFIFAFFLIFYNYSFNNIHIKSTNNITISTKHLIIVAVIGTFLILWHYHFNLVQLLSRGLTNEMMREHGIETQENYSVASDLIFRKIIRSIPWACFIIARISDKNKRVLYFLFSLMLLTIFPTGLDRNATAMYWIPVFILIFAKYIKESRFIWFMLAALFVVFPFFDNFRHFNGTINFKFDLNYLDSMNMDASQLFMAVIKTNTITFGNQLLGALCFWFPRSIWSGKPEGSGHFLVNANNGTFSNVSMPFPAEGYINFGFVGILLFIIMLALLCSYLDNSYWKSNRTLKSGFYLILLGAIIFIMRGDLMSSFSFTIGIMLSYALAIFLSRKYKFK